MTQHRIGLGYYQGQILTSPARFIVCVAGRRFGKTTLAAARSFRKAVAKPKAKVWYIAPTYRMAKEIFWEPLKAFIPSLYLAKKHETELTVTLINGSTISLKGADNPDSLRGSGLDDATFDEFADMQLRTWTEVVRPALADKQGSAFLIGTPKGFNHFYDLHLEAQTAEDWAAFSFTTLQGGRVTREELLAAAKELDPRVFKQEFLASFETMQGRVYLNFDRKLHVDPTLTDRGNDLLVGLDFNINPMSAVITQRAGNVCEVLDCITPMTSDTEEMATELRRRYPNRRIIVCPDASGASRHTSSPMGQTDFTILRRYKFEIDADKANPVIVDRVNNVQSNLKNAAGDIRLRIHPRAKQLIKAFEGLTWKEGTNLIDKTTGLDHITDAAGYVLWQQFNVLDRVMPRVAPSLGELHAPFAV